MSRGADFETGNVLKRAKSLVPVLVPLFVNAFRRADELTLAMEARCYDPTVKRGHLNPLAFKRKDVGALFILALYLAVMIAIPFVDFSGGV